MSNKASFLSPAATQILLNLTSAYGFNLTDTTQDIYLKLEQDNYMPLVLEKHEKHVFSLSHYYVQEGDLMSDPDITFIIFGGSNNYLICPLSFTQSNLGIYQEVAWLNSDRNCLGKFKPQALKDLVDFCHLWLSNIQTQDWFKDGGLPNPDLIFTKA